MRWLTPLLVALIAGMIATACSGGGRASSPTGGTTLSPTAAASTNVVRLTPKPAPDFELTDQDGAPFRLSDGAGKVRLLYFGYTNCPDICPATVVKWRDSRRLLGVDARDVQYVMVTVDPSVDTPAVLKRYLANFDPTFIGLSGDESALRPVWDSFGTHVQRVDLPESATGHSISHSASVYAVDRHGNLAMKFTFNATAEDVAGGVRELLQE